MNTLSKKSSIIKTLIIKDIQLNIWPMLLYLVVGFISLWLLTFEQKGPFYTGSVFMLSMIIIAGAHMVTNTVTTERDDQTLAFILSLPVSFVQYSHAKICANMTTVLVFWLIMVTGLMLVIFSQPQIPNGLTVYATILMLELLAVFVLWLAVGLISESQTWTIVVMTLTNIGLSMFMLWLSSIGNIKVHMEGPEPVWNNTALTIIAAEITFMVLVLALTYVIQGRKKDFL